MAKLSKRNDDPTAVCPVNHKKSDDVLVCPVNHEEGFNTLNNMPYLSSERAPGQKVSLSRTKSISSIPRGEKEDEGVWEYPSPQQMYNAMIRKGKGAVPEDAVEPMVDVHNFLNEGAWDEILRWETPYVLKYKTMPRLLKFTGRPDDMSPKARIYKQLGEWFPEKFGTLPPFDRHDWTVLRPTKDPEQWKEVRYVIDYYAGPDDEHGMPTFFLDVRPALDNIGNASDRIIHWSKPIWDKALGRKGDDVN